MAVVGMATMIGSATGAVLTAIVMLFEMTARLQCCAAGDLLGRDRQRRAQSYLPADDLHTQTPAPRPRRA